MWRGAGTAMPGQPSAIAPPPNISFGAYKSKRPPNDDCCIYSTVPRVPTVLIHLIFRLPRVCDGPSRIDCPKERSVERSSDAPKLHFSKRFWCSRNTSFTSKPDVRGRHCVACPLFHRLLPPPADVLVQAGQPWAGKSDSLAGVRGPLPYHEVSRGVIRTGFVLQEPVLQNRSGVLPHVTYDLGLREKMSRNWSEPVPLGTGSCLFRRVMSGLGPSTSCLHFLDKENSVGL